ncbi:hypothetical protein FXB68_06350 [Aggregatibacter actinomycetemcomitans]|nr:hypothetical protein FXB68_06350 [Aggregatibacter actinomycetemcomitans]TYA40981.1 hypothetical protein FXB67_06875 [Aggregatibacter actinomycetemcomitans]TYB09972.1 hypothetical protein FXE07_06460 [Aggregatibacter actinomycetemcomitans]
MAVNEKDYAHQRQDCRGIVIAVFQHKQAGKKEHQRCVNKPCQGEFVCCHLHRRQKTLKKMAALYHRHVKSAVGFLMCF